ncbi:hypothetical protein E4T56_gene2820 [Termitomyces sp. T112]|nr:hypothetical protein E4T56_gene2820 [Termitomyces sp. T112]
MTPTPANSNASPANSEGPLANPDMFPVGPINPPSPPNSWAPLTLFLILVVLGPAVHNGGMVITDTPASSPA